MQAIFRGRHNAEVAAAAPQRPEEVGVFRGARRSELTVGRHDVRRNQVVDCEAVLAHQPAEAAAERQSDDAGVRDRAAGGCESECLRLVVQLTPDHATLSSCGSRDWIDANALHRCHVDHEAAVVRAIPWGAVTATPNRQTQQMCSSESHGLLHVGDAGAPRDQSGPAIDVAVPDVPGVLVPGVIGRHQVAAQSTSDFGDLRVVEGRASAAGGRQNHHIAAPHSGAPDLPDYQRSA